MGEAGNSCLLPASEAPNGESQPRGLGTAAGERVTRAGGRRWLSGALPPYLFLGSGSRPSYKAAEDILCGVPVLSADIP